MGQLSRIVSNLRFLKRWEAKYYIHRWSKLWKFETIRAFRVVLIFIVDPLDNSSFVTCFILYGAKSTLTHIQFSAFIYFKYMIALSVRETCFCIWILYRLLKWFCPFRCDKDRSYSWNKYVNALKLHNC